MNEQFEQRRAVADEVNFLEYVDVLLRQKYLIAAFGIGIALLAFATALLLPKIYLIQTSLQLGHANGGLIESQAQIKGRIDGDVYGVTIRKILDIPESLYPRNIVEIPGGTSIVRVKIESDEPETAKRILEEINNLIISDHQEIIQKAEKDIVDQISLVKSTIQTTERNIVRLQKKISFLEQEKSILEDKIAALQSQLVYEQTPGTQFALLNTKEQLEQKRQEIEDVYMGANAQRDRITSLRGSIQQLESKIDGMRNTSVARIASVSENPINKSPLFSAVIGFVLGIFLGIFAGFGRELWIQRVKASKKFSTLDTY